MHVDDQRAEPQQPQPEPRASEQGAADGPLAEFGALRSELEGLSGRYQATFVLQLTTTGAVFAFALNNPSQLLLVLILPFTSYLLCARAVIHRFGVRDIARYIRDELSHRVPGGLDYEEWLGRNNSVPRIARVIHPALAFPATAAVALWWSFDNVIQLNHGIVWSGPAAIWIAGVLAGLASTWLTVRLVSAPL